MKNRQKRSSAAVVFARIYNKKYVPLALIALLLVGGSFAFASGTITIRGNALFAAVYSAITGEPMLVISTNASSPSGPISMGVRSTLAVYDISISNVTHWANVNAVPLQISINQAPASSLYFSDLSLQYTYCIPAGALYGYGFRSGGCSTKTLTPSSVSRSGGTYAVTFYTGVAVYPQQSSATLTVSGTPLYAYTANAANPQAGNASFNVQITGVSGSGDQCNWTYGFVPEIYRYGYSYTGCRAHQVIPAVSGASTNWLTVMRPYGYGYNPRVIAVATPQPIIKTPEPVITTPQPNPVIPTPPDQQQSTIEQKIAQLRALVVALTQLLQQILQTRASQGL